jgi:hypothetical protein
VNAQQELVNRLEEAWRTAGKELGFRVESPFVLNESKKCVARLPDFGGPGGMVIGAIFPPKYLPIESLHLEAATAGYYVSYVNAETYSAFEALQFQEALNDWGYFGPPEKKPGWMTNARE